MAWGIASGFFVFGPLREVIYKIMRNFAPVFGSQAKAGSYDS